MNYSATATLILVEMVEFSAEVRGFVDAYTDLVCVKLTSESDMLKCLESVDPFNDIEPDGADAHTVSDTLRSASYTDGVEAHLSALDTYLSGLMA